MQAPVTKNSINLFVDTERAALIGHPQNKGDDVHLHFEGNAVEAGDSEQIRISLRQFSMYNNLFMVDVNNSRFRVVTNGSLLSHIRVLSLTYKNYGTLNELSRDFVSQLSEHLKSRAIANGATTVDKFVAVGTIQPTGTMTATSNRIFSVTLQAQTTASVAVDHNLTKILVQCNRGDGDCYALLGGKALDVDSDTDSSFKTTHTADTVTITGYFPMQRMTEAFVYIRCGQNQNSLESSVLSSDSGVSSVDIVQSNILRRAIRDVEFIHYEAEAGEEYTVTLQQRRLSTLRLFLTDSKGRPLGRLGSDSTNGTAAGSQMSDDTYESTSQSTLGNLFFSAVVKIDIVHVTVPKSLQPKSSQSSSSQILSPKPLMPAREAQSVLTWPDYGRPKN